MSDDFFGEAPDAEIEPRLKVMWPLRPANMIEWALTCAMHDKLQVDLRAPIIFVDDEGTFENAAEYEKLYGVPVTLHEALELQKATSGEVIEAHRKQIVIARELGESAAWPLYLVACEIEGVNSLLKGPSK